MFFIHNQRFIHNHFRANVDDNQRSLENGWKIKNFIPAFLDIGNFLNIFDAVFNTTERVLIWHITQKCPMIIYGAWLCVEKELKYTCIQNSSPFLMVGTKKIKLSKSFLWDVFKSILSRTVFGNGKFVSRKKTLTNISSLLLELGTNVEYS